VRVFNLSDDDDNDECWRNIPSSFICDDGVHLSGIINWVTLCEDLSVVGGSLKPSTPHVFFTLSRLIFPPRHTRSSIPTNRKKKKNISTTLLNVVKCTLSSIIFRFLNPN